MNASSLSFFILPILFMIPIMLVILDILQLDNIVVGIMLVFWIIMLYIDISYTIKNKKFLKYESSFILSFFVKKTKLFYAISLTILCEIGLVGLSSFVFVHTFDMQITSIVGMTVGMIHIVGFYQTKKFINSYNN